MIKLPQIVYPELTLIQSQETLSPKRYGTREKTELIL